MPGLVAVVLLVVSCLGRRPAGIALAGLLAALLAPFHFYAFPATYLIWSLVKGPKASANPWGAKGLEWEQAPSPPPTFNFEGQPAVHEEAYAYAPEKESEVVPS